MSINTLFSNVELCAHVDLVVFSQTSGLYMVKHYHIVTKSH